MKERGIRTMPIYQRDLMNIAEAIIETCKSEYNKIFRNYDGKEFYSLVDDEFIDEFSYFMSGSDKGLDMRIWRDTKSQITGIIEL